MTSFLSVTVREKVAVVAGGAVFGGFVLARRSERRERGRWLHVVVRKEGDGARRVVAVACRP
ncbi:hypothetical protein HAX54_029149, partial [Datura stramonium]|nr:hypothetical protein [Datura stramonium]